jgi:hypothetical protein
MSETENSRPRLAGGIFVALGLLVGAIVGIAINQPSLGMVTGFGVGVVIALVIWFIDSKRG